MASLKNITLKVKAFVATFWAKLGYFLIQHLAKLDESENT